MSIHDHIGKVVSLEVVRIKEFGYFLNNGTEMKMFFCILMNQKEELELEDKVEVFLYTDSRERIAATTTIPKITVGVYGWATVNDVKPGTGVFLDIGIQKEMLLGEEDLPALKVFGQKLVMSFLLH